MPAVSKPPPGVKIESVTLALRIRREGTPDIRALLPSDSQPLEIFDERLHVLGLGALWIEIFVAQDERSLGFACALVGSPEGRRVTEVEKASG